jgi:acetylornithine deacetylase/succinyl-diaminopimelate desuccinylase-like protein
VNVIPEEASVRVDLRSEEPRLLEQLEQKFRVALDEGLAREHEWSHLSGVTLQMTVQVIGDRPIGSTAADSPLVRTAVAAFATQGIAMVLGSSSTDANLPMSLGVPALALPHGVHGHDAHSRNEWCDVSGRPTVLAAELLMLAVLAQVDGPLQPGPAPTD